MVPDEPHQRGDSHLLEGHNLGNISSHVLSGRLVPGDYLSKVPGLAVDWRRRGTGAAYDLAPLAQQAPLSSKPDFRPLPPAALEAAFTLEPGGFALTEVGCDSHGRHGVLPGSQPELVPAFHAG